MLQSCLDCAQRSDRVFCDLPPDALQEFDGIKSLQDYPKGTVLFREGQPNRGIFLLCKGRVRISVCSEDGRRMNLRTASAGEVLGMSAALSGGLYEVTAEATEPLQVAVVRRPTDDCLACHGDKTMTTNEVGSRRQKTVSLFVDGKKFAASIHGSLSCTNCHADLEGKELPHDAPLGKVQCGTCHTDEFKTAFASLARQGDRPWRRSGAALRGPATAITTSSR
jgi:hypothetical protein